MTPTTSKATDLEALFSNLEIVADDAPLPEPQRSRDTLPNPFGPPLLASIESSTAYSIHVPADALARTIFLINAAARKENKGVRIVVNNQRDEKGALVKDEKGKAVPIVETKGQHKGTVLVRFQGKAERKQQAAPRPFSVVNDPASTEGGKAVKNRETGELVFTGTAEQCKAKSKELTAAAKAATAAAPAGENAA